MIFPKVVKKTCDMLSEGEAYPVSCRISADGLYPALSPVFKAATSLSGIIYACHSEGAERFFLCTKSNVYVSSGGGSFLLLNALSGDAPFLVEEVSEGISCAVIINGANAVMHTGDSFKAFQYGANLACGAMHCGRLFGADSSDKRKLCWSGEGGICDWTEGLHGSGSLHLDPERGDVLNVVGFGEKLVLVREYGLTVVSAYGAPENFKVAITDTDSDMIYKNTACVVGGKLLFYTASGLRSFDGSAISKVMHRCADDISAPTFALEYGGRYILSCTSAFLGGRALLCYIPQDGESYLIDAPSDGLCRADKVYVYNSTERTGAYTLNEGGQFIFTSVLDFGTGRKKTVTEIYADCESADIEISNGKVTRLFSGACGIIRPRMRGRRFTVKVTASGRIKKLTATAEVSVGI